MWIIRGSLRPVNLILVWTQTWINRQLAVYLNLEACCTCPSRWRVSARQSRKILSGAGVARRMPNRLVRTCYFVRLKPQGNRSVVKPGMVAIIPWTLAKQISRRAFCVLLLRSDNRRIIRIISSQRPGIRWHTYCLSQNNYANLINMNGIEANDVRCDNVGGNDEINFAF